CLLLIFLLSLRAFIMSAASCSAGIQHMHQTCVSDLDVVWKHMHQRVNTPMVSMNFGDPEEADSGLLLFADLPWFDPAEGPSSSSSSLSWNVGFPFLIFCGSLCLEGFFVGAGAGLDCLKLE
ncbi:hypothetical protein Tco_0166628, partial [Tanacetum coccineum]